MVDLEPAQQPIVRPWCLSTHLEEYALFAAAVGYEARANYIAAAHKPRARERVALGFVDNQVLHYSENAAWFKDNGFQVLHLHDSEFCDFWEATLSRLAAERDMGESRSLCVDISSMTRSRIAIVIDAVRRYVASPGRTVDFVYSLAAYVEPPVGHPPNTHVGPILPSFAGWWTKPDRAMSAVVGLGYEQDKALGAVEHLQPGEVWTFSPHSAVEEYSAALKKANQVLLDTVPSSHRLAYEVGQPFDCFVAFESLVDRLARESNVILLPFGPKLFALCSLLVAWLHSDVAVWRVSAGKGELPQDRRASGYVYGLRVKFGAPGAQVAVPTGVSS